jgi:hypothetical protein
VNGYDECRTYVEHLRVEHSHIDRSLEELQHLIAGAVDWSRQNPVPVLQAHLKQLREQLAHHFQEEEAGGCLEEAQSRSPCLSEDVRKLQAQHPGFLASLDGMIARAEALATQPTGLTELQAQFANFLHELHDHETEENRILLFGFGSTAMETLST